MKHFILGVALTLAGTAAALTENPDGSLTFSRAEIQEISARFYQLNYNFELAVDRVHELTNELETLKRSKCL